jgi:hypothetical protein
MNANRFYAIALLIALTGCATSEIHPSKRTITQQGIETVGTTRVVVTENLDGIEKSWFMTDSSAAGAQYGLLGGLVTGVMDAIINSGPSKRARRAADLLAGVSSADKLNADFVAHLQPWVAAQGVAPSGITASTISMNNNILSPDPIKDAVLVSTSYTLSEDGSTLRIIVKAQYDTDKIKYVTPYTFKSAVPKSEQSGPIYSNTFKYESVHLPLPTMTPELKQRLVESIERTYRTPDGAMPLPKSDEGKALEKELVAAKDDTLTKDEAAIFLVREWLKDNGTLLRREIENANSFVAKYIIKDLNFTTAPKLDGQDEVLETLADQRTVRYIGSGVEAGSYVSTPGNLDAFTTYGNATSIAKVQVDKIKAYRDQVSAAKNKTKKQSTKKKA